MDTTAAAQDLRQKREQEVASLKKSLDDEVKNHESVVVELKHKYTTQIEAIVVELDATKKVRLVFGSADDDENDVNDDSRTKYL